jgi:hypothetical protein
MPFLPATSGKPLLPPPPVPGSNGAMIWVYFTRSCRIQFSRALARIGARNFSRAGVALSLLIMTRPPDAKEIETVRAKKESASIAQDFEKAAALRDAEKQTQDKLERIVNEWREKGKRA